MQGLPRVENSVCTHIICLSEPQAWQADGEDSASFEKGIESWGRGVASAMSEDWSSPHTTPSIIRLTVLIPCQSHCGLLLLKLWLHADLSVSSAFQPRRGATDVAGPGKGPQNHGLAWQWSCSQGLLEVRGCHPPVSVSVAQHPRPGTLKIIGWKSGVQGFKGTVSALA